MEFDSFEEREVFFCEKIAVSRGRAIGLAYKLTENYDDALDAVQDSLLRCWCSLEKLKDADKAESWFFTAVRNAALDMLRRRQTDICIDDASELVCREPGPEEAVMLICDLDTMRSAYMRLPDHYRQHIYYRNVLEMKPAEIDEIMKIDEKARRRTLCRAKKRLKSIYASMNCEE